MLLDIIPMIHAKHTVWKGRKQLNNVGTIVNSKMAIGLIRIVWEGR